MDDLDGDYLVQPIARPNGPSRQFDLSTDNEEDYVDPEDVSQQDNTLQQASNGSNKRRREDEGNLENDDNRGAEAVETSLMILSQQQAMQNWQFEVNGEENSKAMESLRKEAYDRRMILAATMSFLFAASSIDVNLYYNENRRMIYCLLFCYSQAAGIIHHHEPQQDLGSSVVQLRAVGHTTMIVFVMIRAILPLL